MKISRRQFVTGISLAAIAAIALPTGALAQASKDDSGQQVQRNYNVRRTAPTETRVVNDFSVRPMLTATSEKRLASSIAHYEIIASRGGWPTIPESRKIVPGSRGELVALLRQRLVLQDYLPYTPEAIDLYDDDLKQAIARFQHNHGLRVTGIVDEETRVELNVTVEERLQTLRANLPRMKEYTRNLASRYIVVNIPAAQLDAVENGRLYSRHNVVAGRADRPSPILLSQVSELNFNPYWNAPVSIVEKDIIPELQKSLQILERLNIRIYDGFGGPEVDPTTVDWKTADPKRYHFRQEPGIENAMASVKINFPNPYSVYMHDTPTKQLFTEAERYFSSGCVRVEKVHLLTNWILHGQDGWNEQRIQETADRGERLDVKVQDPPQIRFVYLTAWATEDGQVNFRPDVYRLDGTGFVTGQPASQAVADAG